MDTGTAVLFKQAKWQNSCKSASGEDWLVSFWLPECASQSDALYETKVLTTTWKIIEIPLYEARNFEWAGRLTSERFSRVGKNLIARRNHRCLDRRLTMDRTMKQFAVFVSYVYLGSNEQTVNILHSREQVCGKRHFVEGRSNRYWPDAFLLGKTNCSSVITR